MVSLPGGAFTHPMLLAPVAHQALVHEEAELATARGAAAVAAGMVVSTLSSQRLEAIAAVADANRWFQLYLQARREDTDDLLRRAQSAGYSAIVLTLDATIQLPSYRAQRTGFRLPAECVAANLLNYPDRVAAASPRSDRGAIFGGVMEQAPTWSDVDAVLASTALPVWIKGVMHPDDALALKMRGVAGVIVSNHGGRTVDGVPASLAVLRAIRAAVGDDYPLLFDSGIRSGADVFKAIAMGADAVLIGRLQLYALSVAGALGVAHMLKLLREELEICMAQAGCATLQAVRDATLLPAIAAYPNIGVTTC